MLVWLAVHQDHASEGIDSALLPDAIVRTIFAQPDKDHVHAQFDEVVRMLTWSHPEVAEMLEDSRDDLLAFTAFPTAHWRVRSGPRIH